MHFSKFMTVSQVQNSAQFITQHLSKSPICSKSNQPQSYSPTTQKKAHSHCLSATNISFKQQHILFDHQQQIPYGNSLHDRLTDSNHKSPRIKKFPVQLKQEGLKFKAFGNGQRKNSQNIIIYENEEAQRDQDQQVKQYLLLRKKSPTSNSQLFFKDRKGSCNLNANGLFQKPGRKNSDQTPLVDQSKREKILVKKKSMGWDEDNSFHFGSNIASQGRSQDEAASPPPYLPRIQNIRKHSDNVESPKKPIPSFLTNSKHHRNSLDVSDLLQRKKTIQDFVIIKQLGKGTFGRVILAAEKESRMICAIKIMSKRDIRDNNMLEQLVREIKIQMFINHPNIVKIYGFFDDLLHFYIIMECALDGHLSEYIKKSTTSISQIQAGLMMNQICQAVSLLHSQSIIHRDLKPQNVLMHDNIVKICDFGWSVRREGKLRTTFCGTPVYLCPEILIGDEYDESVDIWTIGVILYEMIYKTNPFRITNREELINILNDPINFDERVQICRETRDFIEICLTKRAADRPNIRELLIHQFLLKAQSVQQQKH